MLKVHTSDMNDNVPVVYSGKAKLCFTSKQVLKQSALDLFL